MENQNQDPIYTKIRNTTRNSKVVISALGGIEIAPGDTVDLRGRFRLAQLQDAAHEIFSLIQAKVIEDLSQRTPEQTAAEKPAAAVLQDDMRRKMKESMMREVGSSQSLSALADFAKHRDPDVAKAARERVQQLEGHRDDTGAVIPGHEEDIAKSEAEYAAGGELGSVASVVG